MAVNPVVARPIPVTAAERKPVRPHFAEANVPSTGQRAGTFCSMGPSRYNGPASAEGRNLVRQHPDAIMKLLQKPAKQFSE